MAIERTSPSCTSQVLIGPGNKLQPTPGHKVLIATGEVYNCSRPLYLLAGSAPVFSNSKLIAFTNCEVVKLAIHLLLELVKTNILIYNSTYCVLTPVAL